MPPARRGERPPRCAAGGRSRGFPPFTDFCEKSVEGNLWGEVSLHRFPTKTCGGVGDGDGGGGGDGGWGVGGGRRQVHTGRALRPVHARQLHSSPSARTPTRTLLRPPTRILTRIMTRIMTRKWTEMLARVPTRMPVLMARKNWPRSFPLVRSF